MTGPEVHRVPVDGGELAVEVWRGETEPVLAVHGVSSNARLWNWLRAEAPELTLVAPDLRGRADSSGVRGSSSLARHAEDMAAVLDALELGPGTVLGMSMGAFVAVALAEAHPDRVRDLVLVDGGFPMAVYEGLTEEQLRAAFAAQAARSARPFADVDEYAGVFLAGQPLLDREDPLLRDYLSHDLADGRVRLDPDVLAADVVDTAMGTGTERWQRLTHPARLVYAEWSVGAGSPPAYPADRVAGWADHLRAAELVPGVDHATSVMSRRGAAVVARHVRAALAGG